MRSTWRLHLGRTETRTEHSTRQPPPPFTRMHVPRVCLRLLQRQLHLCPHQVVLLALAGVRAQDKLLLGVAGLGLLLLDLLPGQGHSQRRRRRE